MSTVIQVTNLSKIYRLGEIGTGTISRDLERWYRMKIRGQEDPFLKIGETNESSKKGVSDVVYSLRDINFEVEQGEALGIIGKNGAGKSTLLKIISRVTSPTTGKINIKGRVASLLEVGTGFHPELTGRENIFLNGAILGMRKNEIIRKLDEIIDFSGVERYIDTPVKRYSSGMYVRLAFAVAAHLESEIMIVDEVLAVGDAEFQKKCLGKMGDISKGEGRTILFVSHNMGAISTLTHRAILLDSGSLVVDANTEATVCAYLSRVSSISAEWCCDLQSEHPIQISRVKVLNDKNQLSTEFDVTKGLLVQLEYIVRKSVRSAVIAINIHSADGAHVLSLEDIDDSADLLMQRLPGVYRSSVKVPGNWLNSGTYLLRVGCGIPRIEIFDNIEALQFTLVETGDPVKRGHRLGYLLPMLPWQTESICDIER